MKNTESCRGNWPTNKSDTDKRAGVPVDTWKTFTLPSLLPSTYPFFLYIIVQFGTQLLLFSLSLHLECHKGSQIWVCSVSISCLGSVKYNYQLQKTKTECVKKLKVHQFEPTNKAVSTPIQRSGHLHFQGTKALRLSAPETHIHIYPTWPLK